MTAYEYLSHAHDLFITALVQYERQPVVPYLAQKELVQYCENFESRLPFYSDEILAASSDLMDLTLLKLKLLKAKLAGHSTFETIALMSCC